MQSKPVDDALDLSLHGSRIHDLINNPINSRFHPRHLLVQQSTVISQHFNHLLCNSLSKYTTRVSIVSLSVNHNHVMIVTYNFIPVCISSAGFSADSCSELISKWSYRKKLSLSYATLHQEDIPVKVSRHRLVHPNPQVLVRWLKRRS